MDRSILQQRTVQLSRNTKNVLHPTMTHLYCTKDESQLATVKLATVKLGFDEICRMTSVSSGIRCSLLFLLLFVAGQALAKPGNDNANSTPVRSSSTKHCNNVYNSFYAGPNKKIETILQEMKKPHTQLQDDIDILKGNKTTVKGKISVFFCSDLNSAKTFEDY